VKAKQEALELYKSSDLDPHDLNDADTAHLTINENRVLTKNTVPGLEVEVNELPDGVDIKLILADNTSVEKPVHLCFGMMPEEGVQRINMNVKIGKMSKIDLLAHCTFPFAIDVKHIMDAKVTVGEGASYSYYERHIHSKSGGITVIPKTEVTVEKDATFRTEFELLRGRVGLIDIDYITHVAEYGLVEMIARINGGGNDRIKISEISYLEGEHARAVLTSKIAVREDAKAEVYNKISALAPYSRGHVDCKEIVKDRGVAIATPVVEVRDSRAHVTHEAAIGSVDKKQLETLMARGLDEDEASELIIQGMLS